MAVSRAKARTAAQSSVQDRISELEKLVVSLMGSRDQFQSADHATSTNSTSPLYQSSSTGSDATKNEYLETSLPLESNFGRMSLDNTGTSYVHSEHWTAILDGVSRVKHIRVEIKARD
jgi:hypothetical protein